MSLAKYLQILYASQTGNAEYIANHIHKESIKRGYKANCHVMDDYQSVNFADNNVLVLVASTTGDGDPPDNATKFWRWFRRAKPAELQHFKEKKFALLGLGDTNYSNFCNTAKRLDKRMRDFGAEAICLKGLADDATGMEAVVEPWISNLWTILDKYVERDITQPNETSVTFDLGLLKENKEKVQEKPAIDETVSSTLIKNEIGKGIMEMKINDCISEDTPTLLGYQKRTKDLEILTGIPTLLAVSRKVNKTGEKRTSRASLFDTLDLTSGERCADNSFPATIKSVRQLSGPKAFKKVLEVVLDISEMEWDYQPGDSFGIYPANTDKAVNTLLQLLKVEGNDIIEISALQPRTCKDTSITVYELFSFYLDIQSFPRKELLTQLAEHAKDATEKAELMYLISDQGSETLKGLRDQGKKLMDFLFTFPSCLVPLDVIIDGLPLIQPRYYSVASSPVENAKTVCFSFDVVRYEQSGRICNGLCSNWLAHLAEKFTAIKDNAQRDLKIPVFPRKVSNFRIPDNFTAPVLMVCNGTGITPFRSFIMHWKLKGNNRKWILLHGHRFKTDDALYHKELKEIENGTVKSCLSIDTNESIGNTEYVQDGIKRMGEQVWKEFLNDAGYIYLCGSNKMINQVHQALVSIIQVHAAIAQNQAEKKLNELEVEKRYVREIWI